MGAKVVELRASGGTAAGALNRDDHPSSASQLTLDDVELVLNWDGASTEKTEDVDDDAEEESDDA